MLSGRVALVTGASGGIGRRIAERLSEEDVFVVLAYGLWRRGVAAPLLVRLKHLPRRLAGLPAWIAGAALILCVAAGGYVFDPGRFRELTTPTLLLLGSETAPFLTAATEAVADALTNDRLTVLTGQGHLAIDTAPDLFLREVVSFLTEEAIAT